MYCATGNRENRTRLSTLMLCIMSKTERIWFATGCRVSWFLWSGEVREFKSTRMQKLTKDAEKILNCCMQIAYNSSGFLCFLCSQIICTPTFKFVPPCLFLLICNRLKTDIGILHEQISQGKRFILFWFRFVRENGFCRVIAVVAGLSQKFIYPRSSI